MVLYAQYWQAGLSPVDGNAWPLDVRAQASDWLGVLLLQGVLQPAYCVLKGTLPPRNQSWSALAYECPICGNCLGQSHLNVHSHLMSEHAANLPACKSLLVVQAYFDPSSLETLHLRAPLSDTPGNPGTLPVLKWAAGTVLALYPLCVFKPILRFTDCI